MKHAIKVIAFDADDTLWSNEPFFQEVERKYTDLLSEYGSTEEISAELFKTEMGNLECLGYGAKAFTISMVETALPGEWTEDFSREDTANNSFR